MRRDSTTYSANQPDTPSSDALSPQATRVRGVPLQSILRLLAAMALGALLLALVYQIPVTHTVDIGGYDSAYVQGFYDPERNLPGQQRPELQGSDGARWTRDQSFLIFPQAGMPAQLTLRLRGWRATGAPPHVIVLLNGTHELGRFQSGADWQDYTFTIDGGLLKPNDVVLEIRSDTAQLDPGDPRRVGVLLDSATYRVGPAPIIPYPPQLLYGALAAGMLWLLDASVRAQHSPGAPLPQPKSRRRMLRAYIAYILVALLWLLLYRAQPPYPYPLLRLLPAIDGLLAALLALRYGPTLARRVPALLDTLALGGLGAWLAAILLAAQRHLTLSVPGAEKDFRVFAARSAHLAGSFPAGIDDPTRDGVLRADGFYNLGYPLMLWLVRPFTHDNPFLAARLVAALSGALLLGAAWWLARRLLGRGPALLALLMLALSPLVVEGALYLGTDMPFAALCTLALALIVPIANCKLDIVDNVAKRVSIYNLQFTIIASGVAAGAAFLIRHPGILLLPLGWLVLWQAKTLTGNLELKTQNSRLILLFTLAFALTITPQLYVNIRDAGAPLYNEQAKNIWQAVFGDGDWGRWGEASNTIGVRQVIAQDPARFLANWWNNLRGFVGTGGEDTREFGQAVQLRLLGFPANWLAIIGLLGWLVIVVRHHQDTKTPSNIDQRVEVTTFHPFTFSHFHPVMLPLLIWIALYVVTISVGLPIQGRFVLPLAPTYAIAAAWALGQLGQMTAHDPRHAASGGSVRTTDDGLRITHHASRPTHYASRIMNYALHSPTLLAGIVLLALLLGGFATGADYVLRTQPNADTPGQPADSLRAAEIVQSTLAPGERLIVRVAPGDDPGLALGKYSAIAHLVLPAPASNDPAAIRASGAQYLIWSSALGPAPGVGEQVAVAGIYTLLRIQ